MDPVLLTAHPTRQQFPDPNAENNGQSSRYSLFRESTVPLPLAIENLVVTMGVKSDNSRNVENINNGISMFQTSQHLTILVFLNGGGFVRINDFEIHFFSST